MGDEGRVHTIHTPGNTSMSELFTQTIVVHQATHQAGCTSTDVAHHVGAQVLLPNQTLLKSCSAGAAALAIRFAVLLAALQCTANNPPDPAQYTASVDMEPSNTTLVLGLCLMRGTASLWMPCGCELPGMLCSMEGFRRI